MFDTEDFITFYFWIIALFLVHPFSTVWSSAIARNLVIIFKIKFVVIWQFFSSIYSPVGKNYNMVVSVNFNSFRNAARITTMINVSSHASTHGCIWPHTANHAQAARGVWVFALSGLWYQALARGLQRAAIELPTRVCPPPSVVVLLRFPTSWQLDLKELL